MADGKYRNWIGKWIMPYVLSSAVALLVGYGFFRANYEASAETVKGHTSDIDCLEKDTQFLMNELPHIKKSMDNLYTQQQSLTTKVESNRKELSGKLDKILWKMTEHN